MGCCGGRGSRAVRNQLAPITVERKRKAPIVQRSIRAQKRPVEVKLQLSDKKQRCPRCGYPTMTVNIIGREREQCTNTDCKYVLK